MKSQLLIVTSFSDLFSLIGQLLKVSLSEYLERGLVYFTLRVSRPDKLIRGDKQKLLANLLQLFFFHPSQLSSSAPQSSPSLILFSSIFFLFFTLFTTLVSPFSFTFSASPIESRLSSRS